jgi:hypothetical protein
MEDLLKEFWPVALFVGISVISYLRNESKAAKGTAEAQQPHTLDENFPNVEYVDAPVRPSSNAVKPQRTNNNKCTKSDNVHGRSTTKSVESVETAAATRGAKIALKGKSDVKKAFIYSEILNRKYK